VLGFYARSMRRSFVVYLHFYVQVLSTFPFHLGPIEFVKFCLQHFRRSDVVPLFVMLLPPSSPPPFNDSPSSPLTPCEWIALRLCCVSSIKLPSRFCRDLDYYLSRTGPASLLMLRFALPHLKEWHDSVYPEDPFISRPSPLQVEKERPLTSSFWPLTPLWVWENREHVGGLY